MQHHGVHHAETIHMSLIFVSRGMPIGIVHVLAARSVLQLVLIASGLSLLVFHAVWLSRQIQRLTRRRDHLHALRYPLQ